MTREEYEITVPTYLVQNDVSPEQQAYNDSLPEPKAIEGAPF